MKTGILGATALITSTTIDDAVWLVPYCTSSHLPFSTKLIHGFTFICTLELLSIACCGFYLLLKNGLQQAVDSGDRDNDGNIAALNEEDEQIGFYMEILGAFICWSIAIFLYLKKMMKRRRKQLKKQQEEELKEQQERILATQMQQSQQSQQSQQVQTNISLPTLGQNAVHSYTFLSMDTNTTESYTDIAIGEQETITTLNNLSVLGGGGNTVGGVGDHGTSVIDGTNTDGDEELNLVTNMNDVITKQEQQRNLKVTNGDDSQNDDGNDGNDDDDDINSIPTTPSIPIIVSLTTLGALDEISYFPALIMGKIFTPWELCLGALFASTIILVVITLFLAQCKPLVDCLDRIPLYGIVGTFAIVLTVGLFF